MKKEITKILAAGLIGCLCLAGCAGNAAEDQGAAGQVTNQTTNQTTNETTKEAEAKTTEDAAKTVSGTVTLAGSTSMEKVCEALMEGFMEEYPSVTVTTEYTGSGAGLESLGAGMVDIGNASRHVKDEEKAKGAVENVVALDGIAVIVDKNNKVTNITSEQLADIYTGKITKWSELGGSDDSIVVIGRESGSGTRDAFEELTKVKDACKYAQELDSTGAVLAKVASTPGAIGYVSLDVVDDTVSPVQLNGVDATEANILSGSYALQRPFVMATKGNVADQNEAVKLWFDYIESAKGQEIIKSVGLILPN